MCVSVFMNRLLPFHTQDAAAQRRSRAIAGLFVVPLGLTLAMAAHGTAEDSPLLSDAQVAERARAAWESGAITPALTILDQGVQDHPQALTLYKLRGDMLATSRNLHAAVQAYDTVLASQPAALDVRWAKWSVLSRSGQGEDSIAELQRIANVDAANPLIHMRLAQELRKLDRLQESLASYQQAVDLVPDMLGWRLALARARFDVLDYQKAEADVQDVLRRISPGSPLEFPARNLLSQIHGTSIDRGRRFDPVLTRDMTPAQRKEWAAIRAEAWKLFSTGQYREAEPIYRRLLVLNPKDPIATHQLGLTLMQLGRCKDALEVFGKMSDLDPSDEDYADTTFRMGQCLVELERWEDAFVHFQTLYDAAVEFEAANKNVALPPDTRVLDKKKLARWLDKVRPHVPELAKLHAEEAASAGLHAAGPPDSPALSEEELYKKAIEQLKPQDALDTRTSLMGRDSDFSVFRFVIPAGKVMRDDFPTGAHEFMPLNPGDSFANSQQEIYLVFKLVSDSYDAIPFTAQCFLEASEITGEPRVIVQDRVVMSMSDQSGYFKLSPSPSGWPIGLYRCGLFEGERTSADTQVDEVRFRIVHRSTAS